MTRPARRSPARFAPLLLAVPALCALAGCGYRFGHHADPTIRTVAVPTFTSVADRTGIELQLTEAVQKEIQSRTPFLLAHESTADTILRGKLVGVRKRPQSTTITDDPREVEFAYSLEVAWEDRRLGAVPPPFAQAPPGSVLDPLLGLPPAGPGGVPGALGAGTVPIAPDVLPALGTGNQAVEIGQSRATAEHAALRSLARQVVDLMELPW